MHFPSIMNVALTTVKIVGQRCMFTGWIGIGLCRARALYVPESGKTGSKDYF